MNKGVDIYGRPVGFNQYQLNLEKEAQLKELEQYFPQVRILTNRFYQNMRVDIITVTLSISNEIHIPLEMYLNLNLIFPFLYFQIDW